MAKRYYWLKLPDGFFRQKAIKKLRKIAGGDTYTIIYLKMLLVAMKQDGRLYFEGVEATFYDELALDLDEEVENVRVTVSLLGCAGWVAVANTISNPVCGDPLMPVEKPGQEFWYTPFYFRGEWNCRRQIQIFKEMCGSWITPIEERNPGKITFYFDFEKGDYKCQNS